MSEAKLPIEPVISSIATKVGYGSALGTSLFAWLGTSHFAVLSTFVIAVLAFALSTYLKLEERKERRIERARRKETHMLEVKERIARIEQLTMHSKDSGLSHNMPSTEYPDYKDDSIY